jgi:hypothetical protein
MKTTSRNSLPACIALVGTLFVGTTRGEEMLPSASQRRTDPTMVLFWSSEATNTIVTVGGTFACRAAVYKGIVHSAIYDAVVGIEGGYEPYARHTGAPSGASADAAVAQSAHDVLVAQFPAQRVRLDGLLVSSLALARDGVSESSGREFGRAVAQDILALRANDNLEADIAYTPLSGPGAWVPAPGPVGVGLGLARPLALLTGAQFRPLGPPRLDSRQYATDLQEVRRVGAISSATRTTGQTDAGLFYVEHAVPQFTRALGRLAIDKKLTRLQTARMLALTANASGDACIACFEAKYHYSFWRPITAIRSDPASPDPAWSPLIGTPNHPSYPSAHGCFTAGVTESLAAFFHRDEVSFSVDSTSSGTTHTFRRFSELLREVENARVWGGIHFRSDDQDAAAIGRKVAYWIEQNFLRPIARESMHFSDVSEDGGR